MHNWRPLRLKVVDEPEALQEACRALQESSWAAVDTEADSLHHYREKLCLLQVSVPDGDFIIDPLRGLDLKHFLHLLCRKRLVLHAADFDLRILHKTFGFVPHEIFDTLLAAQFLRYEKRGLADLVRQHYGVVLSKAHQTANWAHRPLSEELLLYAAKDTHYLWPLSEAMRKELAEKRRLIWHEQSCRQLVQHVLRPKEEAFKRPSWQVKGSGELRGRALNVLKLLWHWREEEAKAQDKPPFRILHSEFLIRAAKWAQHHPHHLLQVDVAQMPQIPAEVKGRYRVGVNGAIQEALALPPAEIVKKPRHFRNPKEAIAIQERLSALKAEREKAAKELEVESGFLVPNAVLETLAEKRPKNRQEMETLGCFLPWQLDVLADSFLKALRH